MVVFDLDSTLFDVSPRIEKIIKEFTVCPTNSIKHAPHIDKLKNIKINHTDWGFESALHRLGFDNIDQQFKNDLHDYWHQRFFHDDYIEFDIPYEGAVEYVIKLHNLGWKIIYLTGRDTKRMQQGSISTLKKYNFPLDTQAELVLKPAKEMNDAQFKADWFKDNIERYSEIWFFENAPINLEFVEKQFPSVKLVFFDSTHSQEYQSPAHLPWITNYILE